MTPEDEKKKPASLGQQAQDAYGASADRTERSGEQLAETIQSAGEQQINDINTAEQERVKATGSAMERYRQQVDQGITDFAAIVEGEKERIRRAEQEARQQVQGDRKAAQLTGVTEALASIVNLIGVGGHGASNQVYHSYSQDWMRKADDNLREHRNRIDNMRDRQQALQERLIQLRSGDAEQALQYAMREAEAARGHATNIAGLRANTALDAAKVQKESIDRAEALRLQGTMQGLQFDQREREIARQDALQRKQMDNQMLMRGFVPDATAPGGYRYDAEAAAKMYETGGSTRTRTSGSGSSGSSGGGLTYDTVVGGRRMTLNMNDSTFKQAILDGKADIRNDLVRLAGASSWKELDDNASGRKAKYGEYRDIIDALNGTGDNKADEEVINRFLQDHRDEMDKFNEHLYRVSGRHTDWGPETMFHQNQPQQEGWGVKTQDSSGVLTDDGYLNLIGMSAAPASSQSVEVRQDETPAAPAETAAAESVEPDNAPASSDEKPFYYRPEGDKKQISDSTFVRVVKPRAQAALSEAIREYGQERGAIGVQKATVNYIIEKGLKSGKSLEDIIKDSDMLPDDLLDYIKDEDAEYVAKMNNDRAKLTENEFIGTYIYPNA